MGDAKRIGRSATGSEAHLAPMEQCSAAGPFDQWPLAREFQRFYHRVIVPDLGARDQPHTTIEGGHFLQEDRPVELADVINEFIAGNRLLGAE